MNIIKKLIYIILMISCSIVIYSSTVSATTVKVTTETLYLREKASTNATILTMIGQDEECELIEETGNWYKVKYKTYTGYISKDYASKDGEIATSKSEEAKPEEQKQQKEDSSNAKEEKVESNDDTTSTDSNSTTNRVLTKNVEARILPLVQSSTIATLKKGEAVTVITEINDWLYIQNDEIAAWVRSDSVTMNDNNQTTQKAETTKKTEKKETDTSTYTEKTMYINDDFVNLRKSPNTDADILMVVGINTKLTVIGEEEDWYKVKTSEGNAYVSKKLLSDEETKTTSRGKVVRGATENLSKDAQKELTATTSSKTTTTTKSTATTTNTSTPKTSSKGTQIVATAKKFLGVPYVYGGASPSGFDCSGFTMYVYQKLGISLPHGAEKQSHYGKVVKANKNSSSSLKNNLKAGDIILFLDYETMDEIGHCGIYIGNGNFIHASSGSGHCVKIDNLLPGNYYNTRYCGARRIV